MVLNPYGLSTVSGGVNPGELGVHLGWSRYRNRCTEVGVDTNVGILSLDSGDPYSVSWWTPVRLSIQYRQVMSYFIHFEV